MKLRFVYTGLRVTDVDRALRFFRDGLGMEEGDRVKIPETGGEVVYLTTEGSQQTLELNWYPEGSPHATPYTSGEALDHLAFEVPRGTTIEEAIAHLGRAGGRLAIPPFREGSSRLAYVDSPDGHTVEIFQRVAP